MLNAYNAFLVTSNLLLLAALMMAGDRQLRVKDNNGIIAYGMLIFAFILRRFISAGSEGYNIWLVLLLVILIRNNQQVRTIVDDLRTKIGFWLFLLVSFLLMVMFKMLEYMTNLLSPLLIIMILIFVAWNAKKTFYDRQS